MIWGRMTVGGRGMLYARMVGRYQRVVPSSTSGQWQQLAVWMAGRRGCSSHSARDACYE